MNWIRQRIFGSRRNRRVVIVSLLGVNALLALALAMSTFPSPGAFAQTGGGGQYLLATAKAAGRSSDVLYVLDVPSQTLHAFYPGLPQRNELQQAEPRDLKKDFGQ